MASSPQNYSRTPAPLGAHVRQAAEKPCPSCGSTAVETFHEVRNVPVHSCLLLENREEALRFPRRDILLAFCRGCGFIYNAAFLPEMLRYSTAYEEQQSYSPRFRAFQSDLIRRLVERHQLRGKKAVEIGCGKGDFLIELCEAGGIRGVGIDPSYIPGRRPTAAQVEFIQDFYSEKYTHVGGDLICCRHTLEHIHDTAAFMETVRRTVGERSDAVILFEVPDVGRVLREIAFWDIYYEHCSYFTLGSLARLFRATGFDVTALEKDFDDQYLLLEARSIRSAPAAPLPAENDLQQTADEVESFATGYAKKIRSWRRYVDRVVGRGQRAVIWGSSSKCVSFLTTLDIGEEIEFVVDINPHRHGRYLAGSGKQIRSPEVLREYKPDAVIAMNPIYLEEIRRDLNGMGLDPELVAV